MELIFNPHHERVQKARMAVTFGGALHVILKLTTWLLVIGGIGLIISQLSIGWFVMSLASLPAMFSLWYTGELKRLAPNKNPASVNDVLAADIIAQLGANPTPKDVAAAIGRSFGGQFFAVRFGLTANFLQDIASDQAADTEKLWQRSADIMERLELSEMTAGVMVLALVQGFAGYENLLAQLHLDVSDIETGIRWQDHLRKLIDAHTGPRMTGGIARDFSFGYIPLLARFGQNISEQMRHGGMLAVDLEAHVTALTQLIDTFTSGGRQNAALVGPAGVGKTTIVHAFAEKLLDAKNKLPVNLQFRQVIMLDASSLIAAAPGRGELEQLVMQVLGEAYSAKNIIICLDNAELFFEEAVGSVDLTNVLLPILEAGNLRMILTMDEQRFLQISQRNGALVNALNRISIAPASRDETVAVMQDQLILTEFHRKVTYTYQALGEAYNLSERYVHDLAMPGRALKLLESAASYSENGLVTMNSVQQAIEQTMDIKVGVASGEQEKTTLLNLESLIHERMINQTRAVQVVSDALRRARAGVRNQNRPIGTFLFLGPTGVGKTELAKALADVYFGGEDRMVRLDLNEFVRSEDVARLIADGANDPSSLTARMMKQPFSVVLLDEIEKAHPSVLTTLLQLLDEGILRDEKNRDVSFRDAIVIATSNAGAERIREYIERGYKLEQFEQQFTDELISSGQFRPEFLNRFDEIITFTPLGKPELLQVIDLILAGVNKTLANQKVTVTVSDDAKLLLVDKGYDPRLGARPMRRVVQRAVENTVAKQMLEGTAGAGSTVEISKEQVEAILGSVVEADKIAADANIEQTTPQV